MQKIVSNGKILLLSILIVAISRCHRSDPLVPASEERSSAVRSPTAPIYEGAHDVTGCDSIAGWAWNAESPGTPVEVQIFADGLPLATIAADRFRQDLLDVGKGDGEHAFAWPTPVNLKDGRPHELKIRIAGTTFWLWETPKTVLCQ